MACVIAGGKKSKEEVSNRKDKAQPDQNKPAPAPVTGNVSLTANQSKEDRKKKKCEC